MDIDPKLSELAREKEMQVRQSMALSGGGIAAATTAKAAAAQQTALWEAQGAIDLLRANERADDVIRTEIKRSQRGFRKLFANPQSLMILSVLFVPLIMFPLTMSRTMGSSPESHRLFSNLFPLLLPLMFAPIFVGLALQSRIRKSLTLAVIRAVLPAVARTPGEQSYAAAAVEVCDMQTALGVTQAREMLASLNSLLVSERTLDAQRESVDRAMNTQSLDAAQAERDRLQERLDAARDESARATLRQSLGLCEGRLDQTGRLAPVRERIDAQQEAIRQVMASVRASLAGLGVMASGADNLTAQSHSGRDETLLRDTAVQLQTRARAVEQAVQEVASLRRV